MPIGEAAVAREGSDVTIVTISLSVQHSLDVAEKLADDGITRRAHPLRPNDGVRHPSAEGVVGTWFVLDGETVTEGQLIAEVQLDARRRE